jgi:MFS family permease
LEALLPTYHFSKKTLRIAVGAMFFMTGLCFASWASRIATIQQNLNLSDAALGGVLFAMPVGLMCSLPFSGWIITKIGSRKLLIGALIVYSGCLVTLGLAQNTLSAYNLPTIIWLCKQCSKHFC